MKCFSGRVDGYREESKESCSYFDSETFQTAQVIFGSYTNRQNSIYRENFKFILILISHFPLLFSYSLQWRVNKSRRGLTGAFSMLVVIEASNYLKFNLLTNVFHVAALRNFELVSALFFYRLILVDSSSVHSTWILSYKFKLWPSVFLRFVKTKNQIIWSKFMWIYEMQMSWVLESEYVLRQN